MGKNVHVVPYNGKWATRSEGSSRVGKIFNTQSDAGKSGRAQAISSKSELIIHSRNGQIREKNSFGNDPKNVKG